MRTCITCFDDRNDSVIIGSGGSRAGSSSGTVMVLMNFGTVFAIGGEHGETNDGDGYGENNGDDGNNSFAVDSHKNTLLQICMAIDILVGDQYSKALKNGACEQKNPPKNIYRFNSAKKYDNDINCILIKSIK